MNNQHFIRFNELPLIYGRVPKVANTSIKAALVRLLNQPPDKGRSTSDAFWSQNTHQETSVITAQETSSLRGRYFSFSFVRNPFDRLVSAYNNKILELDDVSAAMKGMGLSHNMPFRQFIEIISNTDDEQLDVHLLPQSSILCYQGTLVPSFIGQIEQITNHWSALQTLLKRERIPELGNLPEKNVRRGDNHSDLTRYYSDPAVVDLVKQRYKDDIVNFYGNVSVTQLISGEPLPASEPKSPLITLR